MNTRARFAPDDEARDYRFAKAFPHFWELMLNWGLTPTETHVLVFLAANARFRTNIIYRVGHAEIGAAIGHDRSNVGRALQRLEQLEAIIRTTTNGQRIIVLNPHIAFRGDTKARETAINERAWRPPINHPRR